MKEKRYLKIGIGTLISFIVIILLVVTLLILGFYTYLLKIKNEEMNSRTENIADTIENKKEDKFIKLDDTKDYVYEKESKDFSASINYGTGNSYEVNDTIHLPYININSGEVTVINNEIQAKYNNAVNSFKQEDEYSCSYTSLEYDTGFFSDKIASLLIYSSEIYVPGGDFEVNYSHYNIDLQTGKALNTLETLKILGINDTQMREKIMFKIQDQILNSDMDPQIDIDSIDKALQVCDFDNYKIFIQNNNLVNVYIPCNFRNSNNTYTTTLIESIDL